MERMFGARKALQYIVYGIIGRENKLCDTIADIEFVKYLSK